MSRGRLAGGTPRDRISRRLRAWHGSLPGVPVDDHVLAEESNVPQPQARRILFSMSGMAVFTDMSKDRYFWCSADAVSEDSPEKVVSNLRSSKPLVRPWVTTDA